MPNTSFQELTGKANWVKCPAIGHIGLMTLLLFVYLQKDTKQLCDIKAQDDTHCFGQRRAAYRSYSQKSMLYPLKSIYQILALGWPF